MTLDPAAGRRVYVLEHPRLRRIAGVQERQHEGGKAIMVITSRENFVSPRRSISCLKRFPGAPLLQLCDLHP